MKKSGTMRAIGKTATKAFVLTGRQADIVTKLLKRSICKNEKRLVSTWTEREDLSLIGRRLAEQRALLRELNR